MNAIPSPSASPEYRQISTGAFQRRAPSSGRWLFCKREEALSALASASASASASPEILKVASEIREDLSLGEIRKVYTLPSKSLALVCSDSLDNDKIVPREWIYQKRGRRYIQISVVPLEGEDPFKGPGARARAEIAACDKSCYWLSSGALSHHGREMPLARRGKSISEEGSQCYVRWNQIKSPITQAKKDPARVPYLPLGRETLWRLTSWGDLSVLPFPIIDALISGIEARGGWGSRDEGDQVLSYSNAWRPSSSASPEVRERLKRRAMASCSDIIEYAQAIEQGWKPFFSETEGDDLSAIDLFKMHGQKIVPCTARPDNDNSCARCLVCSGNRFGALEKAH